MIVAVVAPGRALRHLGWAEIVPTGRGVYNPDDRENARTTYGYRAKNDSKSVPHVERRLQTILHAR
jgi:hypothetical protein